MSNQTTTHLLKPFVCALALFFGPLLSSHGFQITSYGFGSGGHFEVQFAPTDTNHYYILYRGTNAADVNTAIALELGDMTGGQLADTNPPASMAFYRVLEVSNDSPVDVDQDGIDDLYELQHAPYLDPWNPADAPGDLDNDGYSNLLEYLWGTDPVRLGLLPRHQLVINEIDYDQPGTDTAEFVELFNGSTNTLYMNGLAMVFINGNNSLEYSRVALSGRLAPGQYYVIGSTNITVAAGARFTPLPTSTNDIQNGSPDGVALIQVSTHTLIDSLAYRGAITNAVITGAPGIYNLVEGTALSASVSDSNIVPGSLIRQPNGQDTIDDNNDWTSTTTPTPGSANVLSP